MIPPAPDPLLAAVALAVGYLLGSIPFGLLIARALRLGDLRRIGSGSIGATNVLRTGSKGAALATLLLDAAKGAAAVLAARAFGGEAAGQLAGIAALAGHCWPIWLWFRGGKGIATGAAVLLAVAWPVALAALAAWAAAAAATRISSAGAMAATAAAPLAALAVAPQALGLCLGLAVLVVFRHRGNIARMLAGTEPKIGT